MRKDREQPKAGLASTRPVGYASPPESTRFQKGRSGNPKGRPRGSLNVATALTKVLHERVVITEHGQRKTVTKLEAALKQLVNRAASGELQAFRPLVELTRDAEAKQDKPGANPALTELDQEVVEGILKRFLATEDPGQEIQKIIDGGTEDDQSG